MRGRAMQNHRPRQSRGSCQANGIWHGNTDDSRPALTVRIGITAAYTATSAQPDSRSLSIGTYRGHNPLHT